MASIQQLQSTLRIAYAAVPVIAGLDKFTNLLTNWTDYLSANITNVLPVEAGTFMKIVGLIEIAAGIVVMLRPLAGAYIVMVWLICIALQLVAGGHYFDVAVRDLMMALGAFTLAQLTRISRVNAARTM